MRQNVNWIGITKSAVNSKEKKYAAKLFPLPYSAQNAAASESRERERERVSMEWKYVYYMKLGKTSLSSLNINWNLFKFYDCVFSKIAHTFYFWLRCRRTNCRLLYIGPLIHIIYIQYYCCMDKWACKRLLIVNQTIDIQQTWKG